MTRHIVLAGALGFALGVAALDAVYDAPIQSAARVQHFAIVYRAQLICAHYRATGRAHLCRSGRT